VGFYLSVWDETLLWLHLILSLALEVFRQQL